MIEIRLNTKKHLYIRMCRKEAMLLIRSLSNQIISNSPNIGREETFTTTGEDFTISVMSEKD